MHENEIGTVCAVHLHPDLGPGLLETADERRVSIWSENGRMHGRLAPPKIHDLRAGPDSLTGMRVPPAAPSRHPSRAASRLRGRGRGVPPRASGSDARAGAGPGDSGGTTHCGHGLEKSLTFPLPPPRPIQ